MRTYEADRRAQPSRRELERITIIANLIKIDRGQCTHSPEK